ncbi:hypothetical protein BpHYR1_039949, partial [Brachionus plicatilis]
LKPRVYVRPCTKYPTHGIKACVAKQGDTIHYQVKNDNQTWSRCIRFGCSIGVYLFLDAILFMSTRVEATSISRSELRLSLSSSILSRLHAESLDKTEESELDDADRSSLHRSSSPSLFIELLSCSCCFCTKSIRSLASSSLASNSSFFW